MDVALMAEMLALKNYWTMPARKRKSQNSEDNDSICAANELSILS